jgi:hypothetical protein
MAKSRQYLFDQITGACRSLANLGRSLGLSVSGPNLSKSIYQPNNLTAKIAPWALFIDFHLLLEFPKLRVHDFFLGG